MHGVGGHPKQTWEDSRDVGHDDSTETQSKRKTLKALLKPKSSTSTADSSALRKIFWPEEYLAQDIPEARVWTYGYDADVIRDLFHAHNKNSVSQHGRDLAVRLEREIDNEVAPYSASRGEIARLLTMMPGPNPIYSTQPRWYCCRRCTCLS